jgi:catechol 2,3-dioxygenase-like lactoylglutathione lyase family enzyme
VSALHFSHCGQSVRDLDVSARFYTDVLGFTEVARFDVSNEMTARLLRLPDDVQLTACYLKRDGFVLELLHFGSPTPFPPATPRTMPEIGLTHLSFVVEDLDNACGRVVAHGGRVREDTRLPSAVIIEDPDGQLVELLAAETALRQLIWPETL